MINFKFDTLSDETNTTLNIKFSMAATKEELIKKNLNTVKNILWKLDENLNFQKENMLKKERSDEKLMNKQNVLVIIQERIKRFDVP